MKSQIWIWSVGMIWYYVSSLYSDLCMIFLGILSHAKLNGARLLRCHTSLPSPHISLENVEGKWHPMRACCTIAIKPSPQWQTHWKTNGTPLILLMSVCFVGYKNINTLLTTYQYIMNNIASTHYYRCINISSTTFRQYIKTSWVVNHFGSLTSYIHRSLGIRKRQNIRCLSNSAFQKRQTIFLTSGSYYPTHLQPCRSANALFFSNDRPLFINIFNSMPELYQFLGMYHSQSVNQENYTPNLSIRKIINLGVPLSTLLFSSQTTLDTLYWFIFFDFFIQFIRFG